MGEEQNNTECKSIQPQTYPASTVNSELHPNNSFFNQQGPSTLPPQCLPGNPLIPSMERMPPPVPAFGFSNVNGFNQITTPDHGLNNMPIPVSTIPPGSNGVPGAINSTSHFDLSAMAEIKLENAVSKSEPRSP